MLRFLAPSRLLAVTFAAAMVVNFAAPNPASAQQAVGGVTTGGIIPTITFEQRLKSGLRVKTRFDAAFIDRVIQLVDERLIPVALVDSTFFWSRKKAAYRGGYAADNPMVYFRPAMRIRARALGVAID